VKKELKDLERDEAMEYHQSEKLSVQEKNFSIIPLSLAVWAVAPSY
jgi:hypothetical protein